MALPNPENLAYRGIISGSAGCMAWRGFFCVVIDITGWRDIKELTLSIKRTILYTLER